MDGNYMAEHCVRRSSLPQSEAVRDERLLLEKEIRRTIRAFYPGRAGEEWLQVCLRTLRNWKAAEERG